MLWSTLYKAPYTKPSVHSKVCCICTGAERGKAILDLITDIVSVRHIVLKRRLISSFHLQDDINTHTTTQKPNGLKHFEPFPL